MRPKPPEGRPLCAYIDKAAFQHNIARAESLASGAQAVVVIKADAYGHGLIEMAKAAGNRDLAVATSNEASELIEKGITNRIWVLEGPLSEHCLSLSKGHQIYWVFHSEWQVSLMLAQAGQQFDAWLKVDTGMHRLGFMPEKLMSVLERLKSSKNLSLIGLMSHFASSDMPGNDSVQGQLHCFDSLLSDLALDSLPLSLSNSGAVLFYPQSHRSWVRPGIMLYGGMPNPAQSASDYNLKPVMRLVSQIISLKTISSGESVGYGANWTASAETLVATVACGYGDGYPRHAPNGTPVWIKGQHASVIGRVSMDMLAIDVSSIADVSVGDEVELWGEHVSVDEVALAAGTISYELLTGVTKRVPRIYF